MRLNKLLAPPQQRVWGILAGIILFLSLMMTNLQETKADTYVCPSNYSQTTQILYVHGCAYYVHFCFLCGAVSTQEIRVLGVTPVDPNCTQSWDANQIISDVYSQVFTWEYIKSFICVNDELLPCGGFPGGIDYFLYWDECWSKRLHGGVIEYWPCPTGNIYCVHEMEMCWDSNTGTVRYTLINTGDGHGRYSCEGTEPSDPTVPDTWSDCFKIATPCQP